MARLTQAEQREIEDGVDAWRAASVAPAPSGAMASDGFERWTAAMATAALFEAGKVAAVLAVANCRPKGFARESWPEFRRLASLGDYPGSPDVRWPLPSPAEIAASDRRMAWLWAFVADDAARCVAQARTIPHRDMRRPRYSFAAIGRLPTVNRSENTVRAWHLKAMEAVAAGLDRRGVGVRVELVGGDGCKKS